MVLVRVGEDHRAQRALALLQVGEVREDQIHPEVLVPGERKPGVDHDRVFALLVNGHVLSDLAEAAQGDDPHRFWHRRSLGADASQSGRRA